LDLIRPPCLGTDLLPNLLVNPEEASLSVVATDEGFYTPAHVDFSGTVGWMALVRGQKVWSFWSPHGPLQKAFLAALKTGKNMPPPDITFVANAGDLVIIPSGYGHAVSTTIHSFGFGGSAFVPELSLAGLAAALTADVRARGLSSDKARAERRHQRQGIAEALGYSVRELSRQEVFARSAATAAFEGPESAEASRSHQHMHAPRKGRGKRRPSCFSTHKGSRAKSCTHPEHVPGKRRLLKQRGTLGKWYGLNVLMCDTCYRLFKGHEQLHIART
jgi:hypothetical protein